MDVPVFRDTARSTTPTVTTFSILKFIEANWKLHPLTSYSEDNLPNATPQGL